MKKFDIKISNSEESKIKKVTNLPIDDNSMALSWFSSKAITPANNIFVTDLSNFTPENSYSSDINVTISSSKNKLAFANELGILEDYDGNTVFDSDDISVSDIFLNRESFDKKYFIKDINKDQFAHSYYVSRYFTLLNRNFYDFNDLDGYIAEDQIPKSIKVLNENGEDYADPISGIKKYRILLEELDLNVYSDRESVPYKIIVLLKDPSSNDLQLVYDKVTLSSNESISAVVPQYKENINSVSIYSKSLEESLVVDPTSRNKKIYAKKSLTTKYNLVNSTNHNAEGFEVFVPKKALSDNRTYESFNWRLITKVKRSVNVSSLNDGEEIDSELNLKQKVVNCAVLFTSSYLASISISSNYSTVNPYVFYRLEQSPYNLSKYTFQNPLQSGVEKSTAAHWLLNIDTVTDDELSRYDVLAWSVAASITADHGLKLKKYTEKTQGTLILEVSQISSGLNNIESSLLVSSAEYPADTWTYNQDNILLNEQKNNAWPINSGIFEKLSVDNIDYNVYSIFGRSNLSDLNTKKTFKEFTGSISANNIVLKNSRGNPLFVTLQYGPSTDALAKGMVLATTTQFLKYCNDVYQSSSLFDAATANNSSSSILENPFNPTATIEGPMKLLYNVVSTALLARIFSSKVQDLRSSIYYQVSNWDSSYVINSNVLLEEEKKELYTLIRETSSDPASKAFQARNLLPKDSSVINFYRRSIYDFLSDQHSLSLQEIDTSNLEFYIEVTNPDVTIANSTKVVNNYTTGTVEEIPTSYTLFKLNTDNINSPLYAYTESPSAQFVVPGGFGPYVIRERNYRSSNKQVNDKISSLISPANTYKSYPFNFSIFNSYVQSTESANSFSAEWTANISSTFTASLSREELITLPDTNELQEGPAGSTTVYPLNDENNIYTQNTTTSWAYSGDIDAGNKNIVYFTDKSVGSGTSQMDINFIKYIQISLREFGQPNLPLNGKYDAALAAGVRAWQGVRGTPLDGKVDSQTKSTLAAAWRTMDAAQYAAILARVKVGANSGSAKYIEAARASVSIEETPQRRPFKKITYTGSTAPAVLVDTIHVLIPDKYRDTNQFRNVKINSISINPGTFANATSYSGLAVKDITVFPESGSGTSVLGAQDYIKKLTKYTINKSLSDCNHIAVRVNGSKLGGKFGSYASGYALANIEFNITYTPVKSVLVPGGTKYIPSPTSTKEVTINYTLSGNVQNISANKAEIIDLSGAKSVKYTKTPISMEYPVYSGSDIVYQTLDLTKTTMDFSSSTYSPPFVPYSSDSATPTYRDENISIDLTAPQSTNVVPNTLVVSNVLTATKNPVSSTSISPTINNNTLTFQTSTLNYQNSNVIKSSEIALNNYWVLSNSGSIIPTAKNTVSVLDGLLLLCQPSSEQDKKGKSYGINLQSFANILSTNTEFNTDYGSFILVNNSPENGGMVYGFYDKNKKEFLGKNLYYVDYIARGPENIYIGVLAIDADGNMGNGIDVFGAKTSGTITPVNIPIKMACPIYNVEYVPSSRIALSAIPPNLSKFQQWPLYITSGSFTKDIFINPAYGWTSWAKKYSGKTLRATYSTFGIDNVVWSQWAGKPYVDVIKETPTILSSRRIQVSQTPIGSIAQPSVMKIGTITQKVLIETRANADSEWKSLDSSLIRNINCRTGIIDFIIPVTEDPDLIRVTYTVRASGIPVKHIGGRPIPINPFLNKDSSEPQKALHIYIKPVKIEVKSSENSSYDWSYVDEYTYDSPIDFTYDTDIFDPYISSEYDPFALQIALIHTVNSVDIKDIGLEDLRLKGGGVKATMGKTVDVQSYGSLDINKVFKEIKEASSFWDIYPPDQQAYPKGGFVIIKMPRTVLDNFINESEIYSIISRNITAGVVYKIQDMDGNDWGLI